MKYKIVRESGKAYLVKAMIDDEDSNGIEAWIPKEYYEKNQPLKDSQFERFAENTAKLRATGSNLIPIGKPCASNESHFAIKAIWYHLKSGRCGDFLKWIGFNELVDGCLPEWRLIKIANEAVQEKSIVTNDPKGFEVLICGLSFPAVDKVGSNLISDIK